MTRAQFFLSAVGVAAAIHGWPAAGRAAAGTMEGFVDGGPRLRVRTDDGNALAIEAGGATELRRVAPGEKSLQNAATIALDELRPGDRVLVTLADEGPMARRIVVMPASAIASRNDALERAWTERGASGVVLSVKPGEIRIRQRSLVAEIQTTVVLSPITEYRRYRPGSVSYAESTKAAFKDIQPGDQLRARGVKSGGGSRLEAEEVVFGTFVTKAGTVVSTDSASRRLVLRDLETGRPLAVLLTSASQVKRFPEIPATPASGGPPHLAQMIDRLPVLPLSELQVGDTVVFSATKAGGDAELTAVAVLSNAERLVRMAQDRQSPSPQGMGGLAGLDLASFLP